MDEKQIDRFARSLATAGSRRGLLRLAAALALLGDLTTGWDEVAEAAGRHQRRKKRHKHEKGQHKDQRKGKGKGKTKRSCASSGQAPQLDQACCQGLVEDATGLCAEPTCAGECAGCCDVSGACQAGDNDGSCGTSGVTCQSCGSSQVCRNGTCQCVADVCPSGCPFATVQAAINAATPGSTITICPGRYVGTVDIGKNLSLAGAGQGNNRAVDTILDADGIGRTVRVGPSRVVSLSGLRITGGWLRHGAVDEDLGGGGLLNRGTLTMTSCTVDGNVSTFGDGGGGGISNGPGRTMTMTNCTVSGNSANSLNAGGGGVYNQGTLTFNGGTIADNVASGDGGGVHGETNSHTTLTGTAISGNSSAGGGGGLALAAGNMTLSNCQVTNNEAPAGQGGGVLVTGGGQLDVQGSEISGNLARSGGGIAGHGGATWTLRAGTSVHHNRAQGQQGGGVFNGGTLTIDASSVTANHADVDGGGVYNQGTITACTGTVTDNTAGNPPEASNCVDDSGGTGCSCPA